MEEKDKLDPKYIINIDAEINFKCIPNIEYIPTRRHSVDGAIFFTGEIYPYQIHEVKNLIKLNPLIETLARSGSSDVSQLISLRRQSELLQEKNLHQYFCIEPLKNDYYFDTKTKSFVYESGGIWRQAPKYFIGMLKRQNKKILKQYIKYN
jgi:hypothetical protein